MGLNSTDDPRVAETSVFSAPLPVVEGRCVPFTIRFMQKESCSQFESAIFRHIAEATLDRALRAQLQNVEVTSRNYTGVGCYSELVSSDSAPATQEPYGSRGPLRGPDFNSACVKDGGGTLL